MDTAQDRVNNSQPPILPPKPGISRPAPPKNNTVKTDLPSDFIDASADYAALNGDDTQVLIGNVKILYKNYTITCGKATHNSNTRTLVLESKVVFNTGKETFKGDKIAINLDTNEFYAESGETVLPVERFEGKITQPLQISGRITERQGEIITFKDGFLTTCDVEPTPHFQIGFSQATYIPKKQIILRSARFYKDNKVILRVAHLVIPLVDQPRFSYLPNVGQTREEGWFVKSALAYSLSKTLPGLFKLDIMQKKGAGFGFDQVYKTSTNAVGRINLYALNDRSIKQNTRNGGINHQQQVGELRLDLNNTFQNNSYQSVSSDSRTNNTTLNLTRNDRHSYNTNISFNLGTNKYGTSDGKNQSYTISQSLPIARHVGEEGEPSRRLSVGSVTLRYTGNRSDNTSTTTSTVGTQTSLNGRREENGDVSANANLGILSVRVSANKNFVNRQISSSGSSSFFAGTERLPEIELGFNTQKLHGLLKRIPTQVGIGYGKFVEGSSSFSSGGTGAGTTPARITTNRFLFTAAPSAKTLNLNPDKTLSINLGGDFKQTVYPGGDAAQYILAGNGSLTKRFGGQSSSNIGLNYRYNRPYGGLPQNFRLDQSGSSNYLGLNATATEKRTQFSLFTGYDILRATEKQQFVTARNPWQNLTFQYGYTPQYGTRNAPRLQNRLSGTYDLNTHRPLTFTNRFTIREGNFLFDTNARYDPKTKKFPQIRGQIATSVGRGMYLTGLASYSRTTGFGKTGGGGKFDYKSFTLTKSFHDYEMVIRYQDQPFGFRANSEKGFSLSIRLKAFPTAQVSTGGQFGTGLDTGLGDIY
jgi:hypothetical protein